MQTYTVTTSNSNGNNRRKYTVIANNEQEALIKMATVQLNNNNCIKSIKRNKSLYL